MSSLPLIDKLKELSPKINIVITTGTKTSKEIIVKRKKRIFQNAFRVLLPKELYNRPKHGFEVPVLDLLKKELSHQVENLILKKSFIKEQEIFSFEMLKSLTDQLHSSNPGDSAAKLWAVLSFQLWWKKYFD